MRAQVKYNDEGLTALIFTAEGDMRQAINNLQSTASGFGFVSAAHVFKVCDQPHPVLVQALVRQCHQGAVDGALEKLTELWDQGYSAVDIIVTIFRVVKTFDECVHLPLRGGPAERAPAGCPSIQSSSTSRRSASRTCAFWKVWARSFSWPVSSLGSVEW
jgi:DNA polymerase III delta prime subunit